MIHRAHVAAKLPLAKGVAFQCSTRAELKVLIESHCTCQNDCMLQHKLTYNLSHSAVTLRFASLIDGIHDWFGLCPLTYI